MLRVIVKDIEDLDILKEIIKDDFDISNFYDEPLEFPMRVTLEYSEDCVYDTEHRTQTESSRQARMAHTRKNVKEPLEDTGFIVEEIDKRDWTYNLNKHDYELR